MKRTALHSAIAAAALFAGAASAAEITIYKQPNFRGGEMTARDTTTDLAGTNFNDQASSVRVRSGRWQLCSQPNFQGDCMTLAPGEYASLDQKLMHRVESMRPLDNVAANDRGYNERGYNERGYNERAYRDDRGYRGHRSRGDIELYAGSSYRGQALRLDGDEDRIGELGISSVVVNEGTWQLCTRPGYEGRCEVYERGSYPDIGRMNNRIASVRRVG